MSHPMLAFLLGGGEIILILATLLILGLGAVVAIVIAYFVVRGSQRKSAAAQPLPTAPPALPTQGQDLEQQLRVLAKLKEDGVITEEDFSAKKKALLGL